MQAVVSELQPKALQRDHCLPSRPCEIHRWGRIVQWNLGGQAVNKLDVAAVDADIILAQEISRGEQGWGEVETDHFFWITDRSPELWRGVAIGFALDRFDSIIEKKCSQRGIWVQARLRGLGRVVLGSLHAYTGVTMAKYQGAILEFFRAQPSKWRHLPCLCPMRCRPGLKPMTKGVS